MVEESVRSYANRRVREAITRSRGDKADAQRLILKWCAQDSRLLGGLAAPFLKGIIGLTLQRSVPAMDLTPQPQQPARRKRHTGLTEEALDALLGRMGDRIGTGCEQAGLSSLLEDEPRPKAGRKHQESIKILARAFASKRHDG